MLIEKVKRGLDEDYHLELPEQRKLIDAIADKFNQTSPEPNPSAEETERLKGVNAKLKDAIVKFLTLPPDLRNPSGREPSWWESIRKSITKRARPDPAFSHCSNLVAEIEKYIDRNVKEMVNQLTICAQQYQQAQTLDVGDKSMRKVWDEQITFLVVGGQASQFKPIQRAIQDEFRGKIPDGHILSLKNVEAKTACAMGAIALLRQRPTVLNPDAFFGTYGFLAAVAQVGRPDFVPVNSVEFMRDKRSRKPVHHPEWRKGDRRIKPRRRG